MDARTRVPIDGQIAPEGKDALAQVAFHGTTERGLNSCLRGDFDPIEGAAGRLPRLEAPTFIDPDGRIHERPEHSV